MLRVAGDPSYSFLCKPEFNLEEYWIVPPGLDQTLKSALCQTNYTLVMGELMHMLDIPKLVRFFLYKQFCR